VVNSNRWHNLQGDAADYDDLIAKLIPFYNEQHELIIELVPFTVDYRFKALDLGAGTGALAAKILEKYPAVEVTAFDLSAEMLNICRQKLAPFKRQVNYKTGDFSSDDIGADYDLILSGLAIHHLPDDQKRTLFKHIFQALKPGGLFINRDIIVGPTPYLEKLYEKIWRRLIKQNGENDQRWFNDYLEEDIPATLDQQLDWLKEAGFEDVDCYWRYLNFAIFGGRKP